MKSDYHYCRKGYTDKTADKAELREKKEVNKNKNAERVNMCTIHGTIRREYNCHSQ